MRQPAIDRQPGSASRKHRMGPPVWVAVWIAIGSIAAPAQGSGFCVSAEPAMAVTMTGAATAPASNPFSRGEAGGGICAAGIIDASTEIAAVGAITYSPVPQRTPQETARPTAKTGPEDPVGDSHSEEPFLEFSISGESAFSRFEQANRRVSREREAEVVQTEIRDLGERAMIDRFGLLTEIPLPGVTYLRQNFGSNSRLLSTFP